MSDSGNDKGQRIEAFESIDGLKKSGKKTAWGLFFFFVLMVAAGNIVNSCRHKPDNTTAETKDEHLFIPPALPQEAKPAAEEKLQSIVVRGKKIRIGDTFDQVLTILSKSDQVDQEVSKDSKGLIVRKHYNVEAKKFTLTCARTDNPGPYRIIDIQIQE